MTKQAVPKDVKASDTGVLSAHEIERSVASPQPQAAQLHRPPEGPLNMLARRPNAQMKAQLLYNYCLASEITVSETVHSLFCIAEHYAGDDPTELDSPEMINGIPLFFSSLNAQEKAAFCYNQVTEALAAQALPVTVTSLLATQRSNPEDPTSSVAGRFVNRVTQYVSFCLLALLVVYAIYLFRDSLGVLASAEMEQTFVWISWVAFGCVGALVHLLNHALTTTRLQTFDISEERKIWPRLLLGGLFGFVLPWILTATNTLSITSATVGSIAAFFGGYSVRFSIALVERLLSAILPADHGPKMP